MGIQSEYAEILLGKFKGLVEDDKYRGRLKNIIICLKRLEEIKDEDLCLCGSSKQWKNCCARLCEMIDPFAKGNVMLRANLY